MTRSQKCHACGGFADIAQECCLCFLHYGVVDWDNSTYRDEIPHWNDKQLARALSLPDLRPDAEREQLRRWALQGGGK